MPVLHDVSGDPIFDEHSKNTATEYLAIRFADELEDGHANRTTN